MSSAIVLFILNFIKDILKDVVKDYLSTPRSKVEHSYQGKIINPMGDSYDPTAKYIRLFSEGKTN